MTLMRIKVVFDSVMKLIGIIMIVNIMKVKIMTIMVLIVPIIMMNIIIIPTITTESLLLLLVTNRVVLCSKNDIDDKNGKIKGITTCRWRIEKTIII